MRFRTVCHGERFQSGAAVTAAAAEAKSSQIMAYCLLPLNHQQIRGMSTHRPFLSLPFYFFRFCILAPHCLSSFSQYIFLFSTFPLSVLSIIYKRPLHFQTSYFFFTYCKKHDILQCQPSSRAHMRPYFSHQNNICTRLPPSCIDHTDVYNNNRSWRVRLTFKT